MRQASNAELPAIVDLVVAEVSRAVEVSRRLRGQVRDGSAKLESVEINSLVDASLQPLKNRIQRHGIAFFG